MEMTVPEDVATIEGFRDYAPEQLESYRREMGFAMSPEDIKFVQEYYRNTRAARPDPDRTESHRYILVRSLQTYDVQYDPRRTSASTTALTGQIVREAFAEYMDNAKRRVRRTGQEPVPHGHGLHRSQISQETRQGRRSGRIGRDQRLQHQGQRLRSTAREEDWLVMFKNETHNHPTEIEPFGGAATCLGGAIRDPLSGQSLRLPGYACDRRG